MLSAWLFLPGRFDLAWDSAGLKASSSGSTRPLALLVMEPDIVACFDSLVDALNVIALNIEETCAKLCNQIGDLETQICLGLDGIEVSVNYLGPRGPHR